MAQETPVTAALLDQFGPTVVLTEAEAKAAYTLDWRGKYFSDALAVVRPDSTAMVADVVRLCARHDVAITPQGGNTGLVGGSVPTQPRREIVLSLERMSAVEDVDAVGNTMLVQTGCILAHAQQAAEAEDRLLLLSLGAEGTRRIGGNLSTNAGGINVLKYGNMRDLVLGLEVVLADAGRSGTVSTACVRTTPATTSSTCSSAPKARWGSSPAPCSSCSRAPATGSRCGWPAPTRRSVWRPSTHFVDGWAKRSWRARSCPGSPSSRR